ncbi:MAG TPA: peptidoglycan-binding domain-containing protein [Candidatus Paceibacterota bacterium]|nr:peptidoglycan-binding domain-containing protein [Candidatus Paceibacterota bacterium]
MRKTYIIALLFVGMLAFSPIQAQAATIAELQAQINALMAQLAALQSQVAGEQTTNDSCLNLTYNLYFGSTDTQTNGEVSKLQAFLGGEVTGYFGPATEQLVKEWQAAHGIVSSGTADTTGYGAVGPQTREAIRGSSCGDTQVEQGDSGQNIVVEPVDTDADASGKYATYTVTFDVEAIDTTWYIPATAALSGDAAGLLFSVQGGPTLGASIASLVQSSADKSGNYFVVREGETEEFTLTVTLAPAAVGEYSIALTRINMEESASVPTNSVSVKGRDGFETDGVFLEASAPVGVSGTITDGTFTTATPTITGTASGTPTVGFSIDNGDKVYGSGSFAVVDGKWSHKVTTILANGTYTVRLYADNVELDQTTITINGPVSGTANSRTYATNQPPLTGRAIGANTVAVTIINTNDRTVYQSQGIPVIDGRWSHKVTAILPNSTYSVWLSANDIKLYKATIIIDVSVFGAINSRTYATENPPLTGVARGTSEVRVVIMRDGTIVHEGKNIAVTDDRWSHKVYTDLANGTYTTYLYAGNVQIATGTITIAQ